MADDVVEDAAKAIKSGSDTTRVGRWMSQDERRINMQNNFFGVKRALTDGALKQFETEYNIAMP